MSEPVARPTGRPYGFKPFHLVVGVIVACVWIGLAGFVLTHGRGDPSSVNVFSELPPGFQAQLQSQGVQYEGLSPVDNTTTQKVLSHPIGNGQVQIGSSAIVLRTALTDTTKGATYSNQSALMVVVPDVQTGAQAGGSGSSVYVAFLDPVTFRTLTTLTYDASAASSSG